MEDRWDLSIIDETEVGGNGPTTTYFHVIDPTGHTTWMSQKDWDIFENNRKKRLRKENLDKLISGNND